MAQKVNKAAGTDAEALKLVRLARMALLMRPDSACCFFAALALRLREVAAPVGTAATDGKHLAVDPAWWCGLTPQERVAVVAHEVLHCVYGHQSRRGGREKALWNLAADLAINSILEDAHFSLPECGVFPGKVAKGAAALSPYAQLIASLPKGLSAEAYYDRLQVIPRPKRPGKGEKGEGQPKPGAGGGDGEKGEGKPEPGDGQGGGSQQPVDDPGGCGAVTDAAQDDAGREESAAEWRVAAVQAARQAKTRGNLPGALSEFMAELEAPRVRWQGVLRDFVLRVLSDDYSWRWPNRRHIGRGIYLPSRGSDGLANGVVMVDSSGSISDALLKRFLSEVQGIVEAHPARLTVLMHDHAVHNTVEWQPGDGDLEVPRKIARGGTSHRPAFEAVADLDEPPAFVVALTDLYTEFPAEAPDCPVLWVTTREDSEHTKVPFGRVLGIVEE
jgi:predicted metal-dependent peptidase